MRRIIVLTLLFVSLFSILSFALFTCLNNAEEVQVSQPMRIGVSVDAYKIKPDKMWTKAIYDGLYVQDYQIECLRGKLLDMKPIGNKIYVGKDFIDPRPKEWQDKWC